MEIDLHPEHRKVEKLTIRTWLSALLAPAPSAVDMITLCHVWCYAKLPAKAAVCLMAEVPIVLLAYVTQDYISSPVLSPWQAAHEFACVLRSSRRH